MTNNRSTSKGKSQRGFAAMSKEKTREVASKGGKSSHGGGRTSKQSSNK